MLNTPNEPNKHGDVFSPEVQEQVSNALLEAQASALSHLPPASARLGISISCHATGETFIAPPEDVESDDVDGEEDEDEAGQGVRERCYINGERAAWTQMLAMCVRELGYEDSEAKHAAWIIERERTVAMLRRVCEDHGDNDWNETLHLADIIDKHLAEHLGQ